MIPDMISQNSSSVNVTALGTPVANWPTGGCDMSTFFSAQELVFDITLCGDYGVYPPLPTPHISSERSSIPTCTAGNAQTFAQTCSGLCYEDYVLGSGTNYDTAYFEVRSLRVFGTTSNVIIQGSGAGLARAAPTAWALGLLAGAATAATGLWWW
jgi:hypothetical protein